MSNMITTLNLAADEPGEMIGRNTSFSTKGFAENTFNVTAVSQNVILPAHFVAFKIFKRIFILYHL